MAHRATNHFVLATLVTACTKMQQFESEMQQSDR
jgi:hypothetical protein